MIFPTRRLAKSKEFSSQSIMPCIATYIPVIKPSTACLTESKDLTLGRTWKKIHLEI